jgi:hypothetical protein
MAQNNDVDDDMQVTVSDNDVEMINDEIGEDGLPIIASPTMEDAFNEMEKKKEEIQQMRAKFMFPIQEQIREDEKKRYEEWKSKD